MKWSELEASVGGGGGGCKEHPNNKQQQGVCPSCLRDKLSKLHNNRVDKSICYSPTRSHVPPRLFSSASLNHVSPAYWRRHRHHASYSGDSFSSKTGFNYGLNKSKSVAFASRNPPREREINGDNRGSKKDGFWSKLLKLTRTRTMPSCNPGP